MFVTDLVKDKYDYEQFLLEIRKAIFKVHQRSKENNS